MTNDVRKPVAVAIMGPTASGKTAAALAIARERPVEIISVDSALVYREMDIGTAKPTAEELASAPHHLIDIIDPLDAYSVMQFRNDTLRLVDEISARGALPLLVGGTMMYFKGLVDGLDDLPTADAGVRAAIDEEAARIGWPGMHAKLRTLDPVTAERLAPARRPAHQPRPGNHRTDRQTDVGAAGAARETRAAVQSRVVRARAQRAQRAAQADRPALRPDAGRLGRRRASWRKWRACAHAAT